MNSFATGVKFLTLPIIALFLYSSCATAPSESGGRESERRPTTEATPSIENEVEQTELYNKPKMVKKMAVISILSDAAITEETKEGLEIVDLAKNRRMAYETARHIVYILKEKGFDVNGSHVSSVGAWMDDEAIYKIRTDRQEGQGNRVITNAATPLFVNHPFSSDANQQEILVNLHRNLIRGEQKYFTESGELGIVGDALMVIQIGGATHYREFLQGHGESIQQGDSVFSLYLVNLKTGEIIWKDVLDEKRFPPTTANFFSLSDKALSQFPHRW